MVTGHGSDEIKDEAMRFGAFGFIHKPFYFRDIQTLLQQISAAA